MVNLIKKLIRILIVEDSRFFMEGLAMIINKNPDMEVVGMAPTCVEALNLALKEKPDLVLLDIILDGENGIDIIPDLINKTGAKVLIMTGITDFELHEDAMLQGARGVVVKQNTSAVLLEAIKRVAGGEIWLSDSVRHRIDVRQLI